MEKLNSWMLKALVWALMGIVVSKLFLLYIPSLIEEGTVTNSYNNFNPTADNDEDSCLTPECTRTASMVLKNMDPNVDPCEDFYRYACGGFINNSIISHNEGNVNSFINVHKKLQEEIKLVIQAESEPNEPKHYKLVKNLYKACLNTTAIDAKGFKPILAILRKSGGWPVLDGDSWNDDEFDWKSSIYKLREAGLSFDYFMTFDIGADPKNDTNHVIVLDQPSLGIDRVYLSQGFDNPVVSAYYNEMVAFVVMLGANKVRAAEELKKSLRFEIKLAKFSSPNEERRNATQLYNPMTLPELSKKYPNIPWKEYFSGLLPSAIDVEENEHVIVYASNYMAKFEKLISRTPKRIQANYIMWRAAKSMARYVNDYIRDTHGIVSNVFAGSTKRMARADECIPIITEALPIIVSSMYVKKYFDQESKQNVAEMVMDIRKEFNEILKNADWMDEKTRKTALDKANAMVSHIAYPDELLDDKKLEQFYDKLELSENHYFENIFNLSLFNTEYSLGQLRKPLNKTDWISHGKSAIVNAFYSAEENSVQFAAGVLQGTLFNNDRPKYMNYGAIGYIIGHEITHGFDDIGKQFDKNGNIVNWWTPSTEKNFHQRTQCIIEQYGNYTVQEVNLKLNGVTTRGENIADNGGIKIAYLAYNSWVSRNKPEKRLPGIDRTPKQMFWLSAANIWCTKYKRQDLQFRVISDPHSPSEFRVLGPFSNMPEFANDFKCPVGSKMNPINKCSFW